jgi:hypothetical protein
MPLSSAVHIDALLTNLSVGWMNNPANYLASKVFPNVPVTRQSDKFRTYSKGEWFRNDVGLRADTTELNATDYTLSSTPYYAAVYGLKHFIGDQTVANFDGPGDLYQQGTQFLTNQILLARDQDFAATFLKTGVWGKDLTGVASGPSTNQFVQWNNYSTSDPITDVEVAKTAVAATTGIEANTLVLGRDVLTTLRNHPDIIDRINYTGDGGRNGADESVLAQVFGVDRVIVNRVIKNTAAEGQSPSFSYNAVAKDVFLCYSAPNPGLFQPSAGYTFSWNNIPGGIAGQPVAVKRYRDEPKASDVIEVQSAWSHQVIAPELGVYLSGAIA